MKVDKRGRETDSFLMILDMATTLKIGWIGYGVDSPLSSEWQGITTYIPLGTILKVTKDRAVTIKLNITK